MATLPLKTFFFAACNSLICCKTGLKVGGKPSNMLFNLFCSNVARQVTCFCCPFYRAFLGTMVTVHKFKCNGIFKGAAVIWRFVLG